MKQNKIDWSVKLNNVQLFLTGVCCLCCLIIGMVVGTIITQKNVDRRIEKAQKEIISEIQKIEDEKQIELDKLIVSIEKFLTRDN